MKQQRSFTVVSGIMRSGTSAMMRALMYCDIPISGFKFPYIVADDKGRPINGGSYYPKDERQQNRNHHGYWEVASVARGGLVVDKVMNSLDAKVVKIIIPALMTSDPSLIEKVIMMVREPRRACTSMKTVWDEASLSYVFKSMADAYLMNYANAFDWMKNHAVKYKLVIYEELVSTPKKVLKEVCEYMGRGNPEEGAQAIDVALNQSTPLEGDIDWADADRFYNAAVDRDLDTLHSFDFKKYVERSRVNYKEELDKANKRIVLPHEVKN